MTTINIIDAWKAYYVSQPPQNQLKLQEKFAILPFLISPANRNAMGFFDMSSVRRTYEGSAVQQSKTGVAVVLEYFTPLSSTLFGAPAEDDCDGEDIYSTKKAKIFNIDKKFQPKSNLVVDGDYVNCNSESLMGMKALQFNEFFSGIITAFAGEINNFVYSTKLGKFADGSTQKTACLFKSSTDQINLMGEIAMAQYMQDAGVNPDEMRYFGGALLNTYTRAKNITTPYISGYNTGNLMSFDERRFFYDSSIDSKTGVANSVIAIKPGALQIITANRFTPESGNYFNTPNIKQYTIQDPILGLMWDVREELDTDCNGKVTTRYKFSICWNVIGYPDCNDQLEWRNGVTDVFLFSADCCDDAPCDLVGRTTDPVSIASTFADASCAEECIPDCAITLRYAVNGDGDLVVNVDINNPIGGTNTIVLKYNGSPLTAVTGNPNVFIIANGSWVEGATLEVTVTGTCAGTVETTIDVPCAGLVLNISGGEYVNGDTLALGNIANGATLTKNISVTNNSAVPITVTGITGTGTATIGSLAAFTVPFVLAAGATSVVKVWTAQTTTVGAKTETFTVLSTDCAFPTLEVDMTFTVQAP